MTTARVTSKGQITVPKAIREKLGVEPGDVLEFIDNGRRLEVRAVKRRSVREFRGVFRVPQAIPFEQERGRAWAAQTRRLTPGVPKRRG